MRGRTFPCIIHVTNGSSETVGIRWGFRARSKDILSARARPCLVGHWVEMEMVMGLLPILDVVHNTFFYPRKTAQSAAPPTSTLFFLYMYLVDDFFQRLISNERSNIGTCRSLRISSAIRSRLFGRKNDAFPCLDFRTMKSVGRS